MPIFSQRLAHRVQLTTDGHKAYLNAVENAFGANMITRSSSRFTATRLRTAKCVTVRNLMAPKKRSSNRRAAISTFDRTLNGKTFQCEWACDGLPTHQCVFKESREPRSGNCPALHVYNFARVHMTLRCTPAMAAGVTTHIWELEEIVNARLKLYHYRIRQRHFSGDPASVCSGPFGKGVCIVSHSSQFSQLRFRQRATPESSVRCLSTPELDKGCALKRSGAVQAISKRGGCAVQPMPSDNRGIKNREHVLVQEFLS